MSILVRSDVDGHTFDLLVRGSAPITLTVPEAFQVIQQLSYHLDQFARDCACRELQGKIEQKYGVPK